MRGYGEFELDIPLAMKGQLPEFFAKLEIVALTKENVAKIPKNAQGAYLLFVNDDLVYVGKTDAKAGFQNRLGRHAKTIQHRKNLNPEEIGFKAGRILVFSTSALETMLIDEYTKRNGEPPRWNNSGFGSNDPGRERETTRPSDFDSRYPVDIDREIDFLEPGPANINDLLQKLRSMLPYTFRYEVDAGHIADSSHAKGLEVEVPSSNVTMRFLLQEVLNALEENWQATVLPNRVILYRENRKYEVQVESLHRTN